MNISLISIAKRAPSHWTHKQVHVKILLLSTDDKTATHESPEQAAASIEEALKGHQIASQFQQEADPLTGSLSSDMSVSPESFTSIDTPTPVKTYTSPEAEISGKIPKERVDEDSADSRAKVSQNSKDAGM